MHTCSQFLDNFSNDLLKHSFAMYVVDIASGRFFKDLNIKLKYTVIISHLKDEFKYIIINK